MQTITSVDQLNRPAGNEATRKDLVPVLLSQVLITHAIEMARVGRFQEAESLIEGMPDNNGPAALDLVARIRCQQGRLYDAEQLWRKALTHDPDNEIFRTGLQQVALMQRRPAWWAFIRTLVICLIVIAVVVIASVVVSRRINELRNSILAAIRSSALQPTIISRDSGQETPSSTQPATAVTTSGCPLVDLSGVTRREGEQGQILTFDNGLFTRGTRLKPEARRLLTDLAHQLRKHDGNLRLQVIGHTDNSLPRGARQFDNVNIGMSRALAVFNYFRQQNLFPSEAISVGSFGDADPPFANDTYENRLRNQTVTLRISSR